MKVKDVDDFGENFHANVPCQFAYVSCMQYLSLLGLLAVHKGMLAVHKGLLAVYKGMLAVHKGLSAVHKGLLAVHSGTFCVEFRMF